MEKGRMISGRTVIPLSSRYQLSNIETMKIDLTKSPIPGLIRKIAVPASVGFFFSTMYNLVDAFYAGMISTEALAAIGLTFPVFFVLIAMGSGISTGVTSLIANALGKKDSKKTMLYATQSISFAVIISILLTFIGHMVSPSLFRLLGAEGGYLDISTQYMNVILYGSVFFILTYTLNSVLNARGDTRTFRNFLIVGFFMNIILNPIFIFGLFGLPEMGLSGIAFSTVLIQIIGTIYIGYKAVRTGVICRDCRKLYIPRLRPFLEIARQGFPASINMMTIALGIFVITYFVSDFGPEAVAAYGIATRIEQLVLLPMLLLNIATLTIVGQNNGAGRFDRVNETVKHSLYYGMMAAGAALLIMLIFNRPLISLFTSDHAVIDIGSSYLKIAAFVSWTYVIMYIFVSALQGMKKPLFAVYIGIYRQIVAPIMIFGIMLSFGLGIHAIWYGIMIVNWSAAMITIAYIVREGRRLRHRRLSRLSL